MWKKILLASDLSPASAKALETAIALAAAHGASLHALFVLEPPFESPQWFVPLETWEVGVYEGVAKRAEEAAATNLRKALEQAGGRGEVLVRRGVPADVIVETAKELGADLVVVGTHGRTGIRHALLGSIAERVVRTAASPVLTVRGG